MLEVLACHSFAGGEGAMISTGPFMLYTQDRSLAKAAEESGFTSGYDGRTTIFDYWASPPCRRWLNKGRCNGALTESETKLLRDTYIRIMNTLANSRKP